LQLISIYRKQGSNMHIDIDVLKACKSNDRKAQKKLYEICFKCFMPLCMRYNTNEEDARSAFNNSFLKIIQAFETTNLEELNFFAWAKRVFTNGLIDDYRKAKNHTKHYINKENDRDLELLSQNTENEAEGSFEYKVILRMIDEIPQNHALVFKLFVIEGYSHKEIADQLNLSEGTSKWHLSTARKLLREKLEKLDALTEKRMVI
jgi:RNA polymerase sigma factor (sigma-70 family)